MRIFKNKAFKNFKILGIVLFGLLLIWFTFNLTGLKFGSVVIVESCFANEPIDLLFWGIYLASFTVFLFYDKIGKYVITAYVLLWGAMQASNYFRNIEGIKSYNDSFSKTHHLFGISDVMILKDTYHFVLDCFILLAFCYGVVAIILTVLNARKLNR